MPLESQSIAWPSGADHADEIASRSLPESLNRLKRQISETYFNWKRRRLEDNHNNIQELVSNAFQCPGYSTENVDSFLMSVSINAFVFNCLC